MSVNDHLTEAEINLLIDGNLSGDELACVARHLRGCEECQEAVKSTAEALRLTDETLTVLQLEQPTDACLSSDLIERYARNSVTEHQRATIAEHASRCRLCRQSLVSVMSREGTQRMTSAADQMAENATTLIDGVKARWLSGLLRHLDAIGASARHGLAAELQVLISQAKASLQSALASPTPRMDPVFGSGRPSVLRPFGKVGFPITFEWQPLGTDGGICSYQISVHETGWSTATSDTKLSFSRQELDLDYGQKCTWQLTVLQNEYAEKRLYGNFITIDEQSEKHIVGFNELLSAVELDTDRLVVHGSLLEAMELFVDAIDHYRQAYELSPSPGIAYRIAVCYDQLKLYDLREQWNDENR